MKTNKSDFSFNLPEELIAQTPLENREQSRMLVYGGEKIENRHFYDVVKLLNKGDVLVLNEARVAPVRLIGTKEGNGGAKCEVLLVKQLNLNSWSALVKPAKRLKTGCKIVFDKDFCCTVTSETDFGGREVKFDFNGSFYENLERVGHVPLPHYIKNQSAQISRYNTVYAKTFGSSAAPTAGLHFTQQILNELLLKGVVIKKILLNVGLGTFRPVKENSILNHKMHSESFEIDSETAREINAAKKEKRRVIAVGTTVVRTLESVAQINGGTLKAHKGETDIFIHNDFNFKIVDAMLTNFHLPESTLVMLVAAFVGFDNFKKIYTAAIKEKYRFYSFGDCCFLERVKK